VQVVAICAPSYGRRLYNNVVAYFFVGIVFANIDINVVVEAMPWLSVNIGIIVADFCRCVYLFKKLAPLGRQQPNCLIFHTHTPFPVLVRVLLLSISPWVIAYLLIAFLKAIAFS
jgi:hypothetical protein